MLFFKKKYHVLFPTRNDTIESEILMSGRVLEIKGLMKIQNALNA